MTAPKSEARELERHAALRAEREQAMALLESPPSEWPAQVEPITPVSPRKYADVEQLNVKVALFEKQLAKFAASLRKRGWTLETDATEPHDKVEPEPKKQRAPDEIDTNATASAIEAKIAEVRAQLEALDPNDPEFAKKAGRRKAEITRLTKRLPTSARTPDLKPHEEPVTDESDKIDAAELRQAETAKRASAA